MENIILNNYSQEKKPQRKGEFLTPSRILVLGFALLILIGALLLTLPVATLNGQGLNFLDALFTATSAVCVTGLVVVDTGTYFTTFGQVVILLLIQVGGLGFMTFATLFAIILGRKITLKERLLLQEALNQVSLEGIVRLAKYVIQISFVIEVLGALILTMRWSTDLGWGKALYFGVFHAISAFNNAGFDLFGNFSSLTRYQGDITTNLTIMFLIITGGIGFAVLSDAYVNRGRKFTLHSRAVLKVSGVLILLGALFIFALEYTNPKTLGSLDPVAKVLASFFQSVTPRTAGFNTVNLPDLRDTTVLVIIVLMFIGASPGSTGGGIKTTTLLAIILSVSSTFKGYCHVTLEERTLPKDIIQKAVAMTFTAMLLVLTVTGLLTITEEADVLTLLFEVTSAFGTVGLSLGITPNLSSLGRLAIIFTMFCGRVGPLTLAFALAQKRALVMNQIKYPEERIIIG
ncbi:Trk family potassium uptake protein [Thermanaerosceptrum fracticalcis]|uniref:Trk family potassium uptake protein n=1 Tax=Thermanaerosceptrum fracticalcis TaxID=1712410 RepID=A0A7G6DYM1_THEFR|nr:TrkH family potassium uptake protein [Thermanaerosceptrum fracticalcis]QNB44925.1 Trk family potassium uptake protein [Thermanaerosceptrum fracticalcis]